jgi:hypothetical protein
MFDDYRLLVHGLIDVATAVAHFAIVATVIAVGVSVGIVFGVALALYAFREDLVNLQVKAVSKHLAGVKNSEDIRAKSVRRGRPLFPEGFTESLTNRDGLGGDSDNSRSVQVELSADPGHAATPDDDRAHIASLRDNDANANADGGPLNLEEQDDKI